MFISFRETFCPTEEEKQRQAETLERLHKEAIEQKACCVCKHWSFDDTVPAFVTYEGDCDLGKTPHFGVTTNLTQNCDYWEH